MLRIPCPYCGVRDEPEFTFGGPSHVTRPTPAADDLTWTNYLFTRENPAGVHYERWLHIFGCGRWFNLARDTCTHEILKSYVMGAPRPDLTGP
jgi:heterotetrameric sarcosine oxidase delta subunit